MIKGRPIRTVIWGGALVVLLCTGTGAGLVYATTRTAETAPGPAAEQSRDQAEPGILIVKVEAGSPAANASLKRGDILLKVGDRTVNTVSELTDTLKDRKPGDSVSVTIQHGDETRVPSITLGDRDGRPFLGIAPCGPGHDRDLARVNLGSGAMIVGL